MWQDLFDFLKKSTGRTTSVSWSFLNGHKKAGARVSALQTPEVSRKPLWREYAETVFGAVLLAVFIMVFVARAFTVDGPSMQPTLHSGERLLIDKLTYRFREPTHGDIVVFRYPADPSTYFIKRVIGVPGDHIRISGGQVYVNGVLLNEDYVLSPTYSRYIDEVVPPGHYFVLGDNRGNSQDSRSPLVGHIPRSSIVGRAILRYWPLNRVGIFSAPDVAMASDVS